MNLKKILPRDFREKVMFGLRFLPDELYVKLFFFAVTGRHLNLKHPTTFEDKQQWLKLYDRHPEYRELVDKLRVRDHIKAILGEEYLFPLLGAWKRFEDIDFEALPNQFVLKCNHDSGSVKVISDKNELTKENYVELNRHFSKHLRRDFFYAGREYPYKGIEPYILAEKYMSDARQGEAGLNDYKFLCFHGEPKIVLVVTDRAIETCYDFYDIDFVPVSLTFGKKTNKTIQKPVFFDEMKRIAARLAEGKKFVRIDLYEVEGQIYFGEYTFFDGGGFQWLTPDEWEYELGSWIDLER